MARGECKGDPAGDESKMAEDKQAKGQDGEREAVAPAPLHSLELVSVECGPSECPVDERLELSMDFALDRPLAGAWWDVKFLVDSVNERHLVRLGATSERDYPRGNCSMHFEVPRVSVEGIKPCTLANTGLLVASLMRRGGENGEPPAAAEEKKSEREPGAEALVAQVNLVVQVADVGQGRLMRVIYSPLE
ncbi:unnamed protein product [Ectocarpus fasciculatus]